jgi:hypothetical protein
MRFTTRVQPPDDSPAPGVIPGAVHVHNEPDHAARRTSEPERPARPCASRTRLYWRFGRGHRA